MRAFESLQSSAHFKMVRLKNKIGDGKPPFNLHANVLFHPEECREPILCEVQFYTRRVYDLQHRQHLAYELRRARKLDEVVG